MKTAEPGALQREEQQYLLQRYEAMQTPFGTTKLRTDGDGA